MERAMPEFVIERDMPKVGSLTADQLKGAAQTSNGVLRKLGPDVQWVHSYVTDDKIYCVYRAPDAALIRKHAEQAGFPANSVARIHSQIDPTTAE
jgi:hypothetical protein